MVKTARPAVDQLDLFSELETEARQVELAALVQRYQNTHTTVDLTCRGLSARLADAQAWHELFADVGATPPRYLWRVSEGVSTPTRVCRPVVLSMDLRCRHDHRERCSCVGDYLARGACQHCDYEGEPRSIPNVAAEDAHDHVWPGWRSLPTVPRPPERGSHPRLQARLADWLENVNNFYPAGWVEAGGPIRTDRERMGTRHVPDATGFGGWDMAVRPGQEQP